MRDTIDRLFNWRKHPASVLWLAIGLASFGMAVSFLQAYMMWTVFGDYWYFVIWFTGVAVGAIALYPAYKIAKQNEAWRKRQEERE